MQSCSASNSRLSKRPMTSEEVIRMFLDFFESHDHLLIPGASIVPQDDPTLLFVNSGMAPLKPYFLGRRGPRILICAISNPAFAPSTSIL